MFKKCCEFAQRLNRLNFNRLLSSALTLSAFVFGGYIPALADLKVCNNTPNLVGVAIGYRTGKDWFTEGWWRIPSDVCTSVIEGDLNSRYFYLHAEDAETGGRWRGPVFMCTSNKEFKINGIKNCFARGHDPTGFFEVDTADQQNWQVRLTETNQTNEETKTK